MPTEDTVINEDTETEIAQDEVTPDVENDAPLAEDQESLTTETGEAQSHETEDQEADGKPEPKPLTNEDIDALRRERDELKKRVSNSTREFQKFQEERESLRQQIEEQKTLRDEIEKIKHSSQQQRLPVYHPENPESENFRKKIPAIEGLQRYNASIHGKVDPEQIPILVEAYAQANGIHEQDLVAYRGYQSWIQQENLAWADPKLREEKIADIICRQVDARQEGLSAEQKSREYYNQLFTQHADHLKNEDGTPNDERWVTVMQAIQQRQAPEIVLQRFVIEDLNQRLGKTTSKAKEAQARASAQSKEGKAKATAERDQITERQITAAEIRKDAERTYREEYGVGPEYGSPRWQRHLVETEQKFRSQAS